MKLSEKIYWKLKSIKARLDFFFYYKQMEIKNCKKFDIYLTSIYRLNFKGNHVREDLWIGEYADKKVFIKYGINSKAIENEMYISDKLKKINNGTLCLCIKSKSFYIQSNSHSIAVFGYLNNSMNLYEFSKFGQSNYVNAQIIDKIISILSLFEKHNFIHGDFWPNNIMIDLKTHDLKIIDFGLSYFETMGGGRVNLNLDQISKGLTYCGFINNANEFKLMQQNYGKQKEN